MPSPYGPRNQSFPKLGTHINKITKLVAENEFLPVIARHSIKTIYGTIRDNDGYSGSYSAVANYARKILRADVDVWENSCKLIKSLDLKSAISFLELLSSANPEVVSKKRALIFFQTANWKSKPAQNINRQTKEHISSFDWMRKVLQKEIVPETLRCEFNTVSDLDVLIDRLYDGRLSDRNKSMVILASHRQIRSVTVRSFLGINKATQRRYLKLFSEGGQSLLFARKFRSTSKINDEALKQAIFGILHEPPSNYSINRTSWKMSDLSRVLAEAGKPACSEVIRNITKVAGYRWRKARIVLTSSDPEYTQKLKEIQRILSELTTEEAFFSIDEFGPFALKMRPGTVLTGPGELRVIPQCQQSRGCLIMTAALELSSNQVTHFYSLKKNTAEMIRMMDALVAQYSNRKKIFLSWDAASWHISKALNQRIFQHNEAIAQNGGPFVQVAPLPSGAQFLNVIESVFSGMARSIIHNSNYVDVEQAKAAIDRYFSDRNASFALHPKRAGKKIWGMEREVSQFSGANNCKDPRYR